MKKFSLMLALILLLGVSFASTKSQDNIVKCSYNMDAMTIGCENGFDGLEVKDIVQNYSGDWGNIYYNDTLIYKNAKLFYYCGGDMCTLSFLANVETKNFLFNYTTESDICRTKKSTEKIGFDGTSKYKIQYEGDLNPIVTISNSKYVASIFFSGKSKKFIKSPTIKTSYNGLYMEIKDSKTKKITTKTLYSFSLLSYTDFCGGDNNKFNLKYLGVNNDVLLLSTNTRKITIEMSNLKTKVQSIKNL